MTPMNEQHRLSAVTSLDSPTTRHHEEPTAMQILECQHASGELIDEDFEEKRRRLTGSP